MSRKIDLLKYRGNNSTLFTGRPQGKEVREEIGMDDLDRLDEEIILVIPKGTTSFNPSFYLGLLFPSIKRLGVKAFKLKYIFDYSKVESDYVEIIKEDLKNGLRYAENSLNSESGLGLFS